MPSYISEGGVWKAAHEKAVNRDTGEIHDGPDREATAFIKQETGGLGDSIGMLASEDPQMLEVARQHGLTIEQWMERNKPSSKQVEAIKEAQKVVVTHKPEPKKVRSESTKGGFADGDSDFVKEYNKKG